MKMKKKSEENDSPIVHFHSLIEFILIHPLTCILSLRCCVYNIKYSLEGQHNVKKERRIETFLNNKQEAEMDGELTYFSLNNNNNTFFLH